MTIVIDMIDDIVTDEIEVVAVIGVIDDIVIDVIGVLMIDVTADCG